MKIVSVIIICISLMLCSCSLEDIKDIVTDTDEQVSLVSDTNEFIFNESNLEVKHDEIDNEVMGVKTIQLYLGDSIYYPVNVPDNVEYVTDNSKYVYAKDNSIAVYVISGVDVFNFGESALVGDVEAITPNLLVSKRPDEKDVLEAALYVVNDKAVLVRTYCNREAFNIIKRGLIDNQYKVSKLNELEVVDKVTIRELPVYTGYHMTVTAGLGGSTQKVYSFETDSCLTISREIKRYESVVDTECTRLVVMAGNSKADVYYDDGTVFYAEVGNYVFGAYNVNFNTVVTCFGYGEEAKYNTIAFLNAQLENESEEVIEENGGTEEW